MTRKDHQHITIPKPLKEWLREYAEANNISMSMIITRQLRRFKRREEAKKNEISEVEHAEEYKLYA